jgi:1,4-alpha-glucan branching enzyme
MKTPALLALALFFTAASFAQTRPTAAQADTTKINPAVTTQMAQLDNCIRHHNSEKAMAKRAMMKGDFKRSKSDYAIADADKKNIKAMAAQLKSEGVRHPLKLARKQIKRVDNKMIMADVKTIKADKLAKQQALRTGDTTAVKLAQTNLLADKAKFKKDIHEASHDDTKHIPFIRAKS